MEELPDLAATVRELLDRHAITDLIYTYCFHFDNNEPDRIAALFTDDVVLDYGPDRSPIHGRAEAERRLARGLREVFAATSHNVSNVRLRFDGTDSCEGVTYLFAWHRYHDGAPDGYLWARYHHHFRRTLGGWRIAWLQLRVLGTVDFHSPEVYPVQRA
jgi:ketosteroid isomerase-like protein